MAEKNAKMLIIVITRLHTGKNSSGDEYVHYWAPTQQKQEGAIATNDFFWKPRLTNEASFLLIHGHRGLQDNVEKNGIDGFSFPKPDKNDEKIDLQEIFTITDDQCVLKINGWKKVFFFVHGRGEVLETIKDSDNTVVIKYTSANARTAPEDLLDTQLGKELIRLLVQKDIDKIIEEIQQLLHGLLYKLHLLGEAQELLLRIRLNVECFFGKQASSDLRQRAAANLNALLRPYDPDWSGRNTADWLKKIFLAPPLALNTAEQEQAITLFFQKNNDQEQWLALQQLLGMWLGLHPFLAEQQYHTRAPKDDDAAQIIKQLTSASRCVVRLKNFYIKQEKMKEESNASAQTNGATE